MTPLGTCDGCGRPRALRPDGRIAAHRVPERTYARGQLRDRKRKCPGSGRLPRRIEP